MDGCIAHASQASFGVPSGAPDLGVQLVSKAFRARCACNGLRVAVAPMGRINVALLNNPKLDLEWVWDGRGFPPKKCIPRSCLFAVPAKAVKTPMHPNAFFFHSALSSSSTQHAQR